MYAYMHRVVLTTCSDIKLLLLLLSDLGNARVMTHYL